MGNKDRPKETKKKKVKKPASAKVPAGPRERFTPPPPLPRQERD